MPSSVRPLSEPLRQQASCHRGTRLPCAIGAAALCAALLGTAGGCATARDPGPDESTQRRAAIERWNRCLERQGGALAAAVGNGAPGRAADAGSSRALRDCEGHRRDVVTAFPPHMEKRLERLLDERAARRLQLRLGESAGAAPLDALVRRLIDAFAPG